MKNCFYLFCLLSLFSVQLKSQEITPENHPMLGTYYATYEDKDGTSMEYQVSVTPADDSFPNSLYVANLMPNFQSEGSITYSTPATIISESSVGIETGYPIEGNVDLTNHPGVGEVCNLYLLAAYINRNDTALMASVYTVPMSLSDDGKSIIIEEGENYNALVTVPIIGYPKGLYARCIRLPFVMTVDKPVGIDESAAAIVSVYPTATDSDLFISGYVGKAFLYGMNGELVRCFDCLGNDRFDVSGLQRGTYVLDMGSSSVKIVRK